MPEISNDVLAAKLDAMQGEVNRRFEESKEASTSRHLENVANMAQIQALQREANGRLIRAEIRLDAQQSQIDRLFAKVAVRVAGVTLKDLGLWVSIIGGSIAAAWWVLTVLLNFQRVPPQ